MFFSPSYSTLMETADETGAGITSPPSPGRSVNVADAERAYLGEGRDDDTDSPSNPNQLSVKNFDYEVIKHSIRYVVVNHRKQKHKF